MFKGFDRRSAARAFVTLAISTGGGFLAYLLGLPVAWIAGGLLAVAIASLAGINTEVPRALRVPIYLALGVYAGSGVSPETLRQMQTWPGSFAILAISMVALIAGSYWWLHGRNGWDRNSALLASLPGALNYVLAAAEDLRADLKKVAIAQSIRVIVLVEAIPLVALLVGKPVRAPVVELLPVAGLRDLGVLFIAGAAASFLLERLKLPGAWMLGGLLASAALLLSGIVEARLPDFLVIPCMIAMGAVAGSRFRPGDLATLPRIAGPALVALAIATGFSAFGAGAVTLFYGVNFIQTLMAFAPGALEVLIILAYQMDIDPAYVAAHQVARFLALVAAVPILARWLNRHP